MSSSLDILRFPEIFKPPRMDFNVLICQDENSKNLLNGAYISRWGFSIFPLLNSYVPFCGSNTMPIVPTILLLSYFSSVRERFSRRSAFFIFSLHFGCLIFSFKMSLRLFSKELIMFSFGFQSLKRNTPHLSIVFSDANQMDNL